MKKTTFTLATFISLLLITLAACGQSKEPQNINTPSQLISATTTNTNLHIVAKPQPNTMRHHKLYPFTWKGNCFPLHDEGSGDLLAYGIDTYTFLIIKNMKKFSSASMIQTVKKVKKGNLNFLALTNWLFTQLPMPIFTHLKS